MKHNISSCIKNETLSTAPCRAKALSSACLRVSILMQLEIKSAEQRR